jgi:hypothetical protein
MEYHYRYNVLIFFPISDIYQEIQYTSFLDKIVSISIFSIIYYHNRINRYFNYL